MSATGRIGMSTMPLPHNCLYRKFGDIVPSGCDDPVGDRLACMAHAADGLKGKESAGVPKPNRDFHRTSCPIMDWDGHCGPPMPTKSGGEKSKVPDRCGLPDPHWKGGGDE